VVLERAVDAEPGPGGERDTVVRGHRGQP